MILGWAAHGAMAPSLSAGADDVAASAVVDDGATGPHLMAGAAEMLIGAGLAGAGTLAAMAASDRLGGAADPEAAFEAAVLGGGEGWGAEQFAEQTRAMQSVTSVSEEGPVPMSVNTTDTGMGALVSEGIATLGKAAVDEILEPTRPNGVVNRASCRCGCLDAFASWHEPQFTAICAEVDRLKHACEAGSPEMKLAHQLNKTATGYQGGVTCMPVLPPVAAHDNSSDTPACLFQASLGGHISADWACGSCDSCDGADVDAMVFGDEDEEQSEATSVGDASSPPLPSPWLPSGTTRMPAERLPLRVDYVHPAQRFENYVCGQAQELSTLRLEGFKKLGVCPEARCSILRVGQEYFTRKLAKLDSKSRAQVLGLTRYRTGCKLNFSEIASSEDLPVCCGGRCLKNRVSFPLLKRLGAAADNNTRQDEKHELRRQVAMLFPKLCFGARRLLLGASSGASADVDAELQLLVTMGLSVDRTHGNCLQEPVNKTAAYIRCAIQQHLDTFTWCDPGHRSNDEMVVRRPVSQEANGVGKLWELFQQFNPGCAEQISETTFRKYIGEWLAFEHAKLFGCVEDHNCCKLCKRLQAAMHTMYRQHKEQQAKVSHLPPDSAERSAAQSLADQAFRAHAEVRETLAAHNTRNMILRGYKNRAKHVAVAASMQGVNQFSVKHNDDKTPAQAPTVAKASSGLLHAYYVDVHGEFDLVDHTCSVMLPEPGCGSKDTNLTLDLILLDIINRKKPGEEVLHLVSDCGPHQHNHYMLSLAQFLVDHGFYSFVVLIFLEQEHSKEKCDMVFGVLTQVWRKMTLITFECLGRAAAKLPKSESVGRRYRVHFVNGEACSSFYEHLDARCNTITGISRNGEKARNEHVMVFGHDLSKLSKARVSFTNSAGEQVTTSQYAEIKAVCQEKRGWARFWNLPPHNKSAENTTEDATTPLYARVTPEYRDVLMHKQHPTYVPIGRRADSLTSNGDKKSMTVVASVKALIGWCASLTGAALRAPSSSL
eukprot:COSAG01_NODE_702_length_14141_cov_36.742739_13_plen_999_part_00